MGQVRRLNEERNEARCERMRSSMGGVRRAGPAAPIRAVRASGTGPRLVPPGAAAEELASEDELARAEAEL